MFLRYGIKVEDEQRAAMAATAAYHAKKTAQAEQKGNIVSMRSNRAGILRGGHFPAPFFPGHGQNTDNIDFFFLVFSRFHSS